MSTSYQSISNLLYRYAELMDAGDLEGVSGLFADARVKTYDGLILRGKDEMLANWRKHVRIYPCGTPRTKHVITNPIIEIDETSGTATCRSYYQVLQAAPGLPLQIIAAGRYHDELKRVENEWRLTYRDYSLLDLIGDFSAHLLAPVDEGDPGTPSA